MFSLFSLHEMSIFRDKYFTRHWLPLSGFAMVTAQVKVAIRCVRVVAFEMELNLCFMEIWCIQYSLVVACCKSRYWSVAS